VELQFCNALEPQQSPQICTDGKEGAIITWMDYREIGGYAHIYAQRVDSTGSTNWTNNGIVICNAFEFQQFPKICSDGQGGALITWQR